MTREQAVAKLRKLYGPKAYWRVGERQSSPERREAAGVEYAEAKRKYEAIKVRVEEWLKAQPEYQAMIAERRQLYEQKELAMGECFRYRFAVGARENGIFTTLYGEGDTWEEAIAQAEAKRAKSA